MYISAKVHARALDDDRVVGIGRQLSAHLLHLREHRRPAPCPGRGSGRMFTDTVEEPSELFDVTYVDVLGRQHSLGDRGRDEPCIRAGARAGIGRRDGDDRSLTSGYSRRSSAQNLTRAGGSGPRRRSSGRRRMNSSEKFTSPRPRPCGKASPDRRRLLIVTTALLESCSARR